MRRRSFVRLAQSELTVGERHVWSAADVSWAVGSGDELLPIRPFNRP